MKHKNKYKNKHKNKSKQTNYEPMQLPAEQGNVNAKAVQPVTKPLLGCGSGCIKSILVIAIFTTFFVIAVKECERADLRLKKDKQEFNREAKQPISNINKTYQMLSVFQKQR